MNPPLLTKLQVFREMKKCVLARMDQGQLSPHEAQSILRAVEEQLLEADPAAVDGLCADLSARFPVLKSVQKKLELHQLEQCDQLVRLVLEEVMNLGNLSLAATLMDQLAATKNDHAKIQACMRNLCPIELKAVQLRSEKN